MRFVVLWRPTWEPSALGRIEVRWCVASLARVGRGRAFVWAQAKAAGAAGGLYKTPVRSEQSEITRECLECFFGVLLASLRTKS